MEYNVIPYLNKILNDLSDPSILKCAVACLANIATCSELKKSIMENRCLVKVMKGFLTGLSELDTDLVKYSLYFIGNMCEDCPEAAYIFGRIKLIKVLAKFFASKLIGELIGDGLDALYILVQIKENL